MKQKEYSKDEIQKKKEELDIKIDNETLNIKKYII